MPEEDYVFTPASKLMQATEIEQLAKIFVAQGVNKIRLTGGEPLVRKDAGDIILRLSKLPVDLTITTNGTRIPEFLEVFKQAGMHSINISLDTLNRDKFQMITRRDQFDLVYENIQLLLDSGIKVKINAVVMKGVNDDEIIDFISWTKDHRAEVRFIEFMPFDGNHWASDKVVTLKQMLDIIQQKYSYIPLEQVRSETSKPYRVPGHAGTFAVISTMSANFCGDCNRMRLTADGKMKNCLFSQNETDLLNPLRRGEDIVSLIRQNIQSKAKQLGGQFDIDFENLQAEDIHNRSMITIGG
jgi:cyclic pyranopterin phosphate synthase